MPAKDPAALEAFLAEPRNAVVIGRRADGRPHATPNWFVWRDGRFHVSTTKDRAKYRIFARDPRVQLVIDDSSGFRCAILDGTVEILENVDDGLATFAEIRAKHGRAGASWEELRAELVRDKRVLLVITPATAPSEWLTIGL
jgi:PPOX class probable F420-dependent enzyme